MVKYIYMIRPRAEYYLHGDVYIGSSAKNPKQTFCEDKSQYKLYKKGKFGFLSEYELFEKYGVDELEIVELKCLGDVSKEEARQMEEAVRLRTACINKNKAYRSQDDKIQYFRTYYQDNKQRWKEIYNKKSIDISKKDDCKNREL